MFRVILQKFTIILVYSIFVESNDLLNLFRPKPDLPPELNEFLTEVQHHKKDFAYIQNVAKNKKKYEKSIAENHQLFAEDLDNQLTPEAFNGKQFIGYEEQNPQNDRLYVNNQNSRQSEYNRENSIRSFYPNERYSRYIHSPVRLRRKFEPNYLDSHVQINPNGMYGDIKRLEPKLPGNRFIDQQNKYHTGYIVGMEDGANTDYYLDLRPVEKKKREVEISIKSDGKLVKKIEEDENGPKSIVLNIKASGADAKSLLDNSAAQAGSNQVITPVPLNSDQENNKNNNNNGPSNDKTIPSVSNNNANQNGAANKKFGVPINSIPASNNVFANNNKYNAPKPSEDNALNSKNDIQPLKNNNYNMQEISKVSNFGGKQQNMDLYESKPLSGYKPSQYSDNLKWSGSNNQMAKTIDIAQNNDLERNKEEPSKESDFERVQGLVIDSTSANSENADKNNFKYFKKRQSAKSKRWNEFLNAPDSGVINNSPLDFQEINSNGRPVEKFDYIGPIDSNLPAVPISDLNQPNPQYLNWEVKDNSLQNNLDQNYNDLGYSTPNMIILPVNYLTTPCLVDINLAKGSNNFEQEKEEAKLIGKAIVQELEKQKEVVEDGKYEREKAEGTDTKNEIEERKGELLENMDANQLEAKVSQAISHINGNKIKEPKHESNKVQNENGREMDQNKPVPGHYQGHANQRTYDNKRQIVKTNKQEKYSKKSEELEGKQTIDKPSKSKREEQEQHHSEEDTLRNRKHLPTLPKYKRKRVRQHPKKRVERDEDIALVDYYDVNRLYGAPDDTFDFIPSYNKRQLKSVNYEFDPNLLHDVDNHEEKDIKEFEKNLENNGHEDKIEDKTKKDSDRESQKYRGFRKKFKSEGDYSDEEDSAKMSSVSKILPIKKTLNKFAPNVEPTTEENDDDYNYEDLSDMDKEDEDVAYEEEKSDDKGDDQIEINNNNKSEHEDDRFNERTIVTLMIIPEIILETKTDQPNSKSLGVKVNTHNREIDQHLFKIAETENDHEGENHNKQDSVHRGHSAGANKRKMGKRKPRESNKNDRLIKRDEEDLTEGVSSLHGRGNPSFKFVKHKQLNPKREDFGTEDQKQNVMVIDKAAAESFAGKPLSNQQKQDIFLRYNPDFQRWPRFIQNDNKYREMMRERSLENQRRRLRNVHERNMFPISNEYFLSKPEVIKREEPASEATTAAGESPAAETTATAAAADEPKGTTEETFPEQKEQATSSMEAEGGNKEGLSDATLPQAAKNILQTANSDIFENTTCPSLESAEAGNQSVAAQAGGGPPTQFQFTTNADDLTQNDKCLTKQDDLNTLTPCPEENGTYVPVTITSVLPLIPESVTLLKVNMTKAEYLDLNEIVGGNLPRNIVAKSLTCARGNIRHGLNSGKFNMNLQLVNYNSSAETRLILNEMTHLMLKLKYHTTCQILPEGLKSYIKILTKNEMDSPMQKLQEMEDVDFDEHQSSYVFHGGESENIQSKANAMKDLLNKFNNLPENCKERAEPIKEYIESHLAMIDSVGGKGAAHPKVDEAAAATAVATGSSAGTGEPATTGHPKAKKEISKSNLDYGNEKELNNQMMEDGMNNQIPDANRVIEDKEKTNKREAEYSGILNSPFDRGLSTSTSPQYGKLAEAVRKLQQRKESVKRIGEIYGRSKREELDSIDREEQFKKENKGFESPLVLNF